MSIHLKTILHWSLKVEGIASIDHEERWKQLNAQEVNAYQQGKYQQGIVFAEKAYHYALKHLGTEHPNTLTSINNLAMLYESQARYSEAEPLLKQALHRTRLYFINQTSPDQSTKIRGCGLHTSWLAARPSVLFQRRIQGDSQEGLLPSEGD